MFFSAKPDISLQPFIENIWYCRKYVAAPEKTVTLPFGHMEIVIKFSGDYEIKYAETTFIGTDFWISGQLSGPTITTIKGLHECMGIVFTPLGWNAFLKIDGAELVNRSVGLEQLPGNELLPLKNELEEIKLPEARMHRLQQFLRKKLTSEARFPNIQHALYLIQSSNPKKKLTVNHLCQELNISRKSLNHQFQKYIGLSVSTYLQQKIFNGVIRDISMGKSKRLIEVGYEYHFFDQAHFIKQFQSISGMTPGHYRQMVKNNSVDKAFPNFLSC